MIIKTLEVLPTKRLAAHLADEEGNERVFELGARDTFAQNVQGALDEMAAITRHRGYKKPVAHVVMNPPPGVEFNDEQWGRAWQLYEDEFQLAGHQYVEVEHVKNGHAHRHRVYNKVDVETLRATHLPYSHIRNEKIARRIEFELGLPVTAGRHNYAVARRLREEGHHQVVDYMAAAGVHKRLRPQAQAVFEHAQRAKRTGIDPRDVQAQLREAFEASDSAQAFAAALTEHGLQLAQGRKVPVVIDRAGEAHPVLRALKRAGLDLRKRDLDPRLEGLQLRPAEDVALEVRLSALHDQALPTRVSKSKPDAQKTLSEHDRAQEDLAAKLAEQLLSGGGPPPAGGDPAAAPSLGLGQAPALPVGQEFAIDGEIRLLAAKLTDPGLSAAARREIEKTLELKQREKADARRREQEARITAPRPVTMPVPKAGASPVLQPDFNPAAWAWLAPSATRYRGRISAPRPVPVAKVRRRRYQDDTYIKPVMREENGYDAEHREAARKRETPDRGGRRGK